MPSPWSTAHPIHLRICFTRSPRICRN